MSVASALVALLAGASVVTAQSGRNAAVLSKIMEGSGLAS